MRQPFYIAPEALAELAVVVATGLIYGHIAFKCDRYTVIDRLPEHDARRVDTQLWEISRNPDLQHRLRELVDYEETKLRLKKLEEPPESTLEEKNIRIRTTIDGLRRRPVQ